MNAENDSINYYINLISKYGLLTRAEEQTIATNIQKDIEKDKNINLLVQSNLKLVVKIAHKYKNYGVDLMDVICMGNEGLSIAAERYRPTKAKFSSYAAFWIKQKIRRGISAQARDIRIPASRLTQIHKINVISKSMEEELGREPTAEEISEITGIKQVRIQKILGMQISYVHIDAPCPEVGNKTFAEIIPDNNAIAPDAEAVMLNEQDWLAQTLKDLPLNEQEVLKARFGLDGHQPKTLEEIGKNMGLTRERIRQIEAKSLKRLKGKFKTLSVPSNLLLL